MGRIRRVARKLVKNVFHPAVTKHPKELREEIGSAWGFGIRNIEKYGNWTPRGRDVAKALELGLRRVNPEGRRVIVLAPFVYTRAIKRMLERNGFRYAFVDAAEEALTPWFVDPYEIGGLSRLFRAYKKRRASVLDEIVGGVYLAPIGEDRAVFATYEATPLLLGPHVGTLARILLRGPLVYATDDEDPHAPFERAARAMGARIERIPTRPVRAYVVFPPKDQLAREIMRAIDRAIASTPRRGVPTWSRRVSALAASLGLLYSRLSKKERRRFWRYLSRLARV